MKAQTLALIASLLPTLALAHAPEAPSKAGTLQTSFITMPTEGSLSFKMRIGTQTPNTPVIGDVLYIHGFGDRLDNHGPLFDEWNRAGLRVIAFDLPSHGENEGRAGNIDYFIFERIGKMVARVEKLTREDAQRPLILAGWSTGGLIATRMVQNLSREAIPGRSLSGLILFAPAISVPVLIGERGIVTLRTLTHNPSPPHNGELSPKSPFEHPIFSGQLILQSGKALFLDLPKTLPVLTMLGDPKEDRYINTQVVRDWVISKRSPHSARHVGLQCLGAKHELDNEPASTGEAIRQSAALFALHAASGDIERFKPSTLSPCAEF